MKKVLVISSSIRSGSNSAILAMKFGDGASDAGNDVEYISLKNVNLGFCRGCLACQNTHKCVIQDDANSIVEKIKEADVLCLASPIYFYGMSGTLKTLLDRTNPIYGTKYNFKDVYLIATCADDDPNCLDRFVNSIQGWIDCFDNATIKGVIKGISLNDPNAVTKDDRRLNETYKLGLKVK